jgi:hypothetical protein
VFDTPLGVYAHDWRCHRMAQEYGWTLEYIENLPLDRFQRLWGILMGYEEGWQIRRGHLPGDR